MVDINKADINSYDLSRIGAIIKILEKLVELGDIKIYIETKHNFNDFSKYIKSYEFCICFCLYQIMGILRDNQEFLDFKEDRLFVRAYNNIIARSKFPRDTELCIFANNVFGLIDLIFKKVTYEELSENMPNVIEYILTPFKEILYNKFELTEKYKDLNKDDIFSRLAKSYFHLVFHDCDKIRRGYDIIVNKGKPIRTRLNMIDSFLTKPKEEHNSSVFELNNEEDIFDLFHNTSVDRVVNIQETLGDQLFFEGYKLIIDYLWDKLFINPFSNHEFLKNIVLSKDWAEFDSYFNKIRDDIIVPLEKRNEAINVSFETNFFKHSRIQNETLEILKKKNLFSVEREDLTEKEKLDRFLLWYPVILVDSKSSVSCANNFIIILTGLIKLNEETIEIIRFFHPNRFGYSYAILVESPTYNVLLDYARWYVYLDFATDQYGTAALVKKKIDEYINQSKSKINICEHTIHLEDLQDYLKDKEIIDLSNKIGELDNFKADSKGIIFELITAYIFSRLGYQVYWSLKEKCTNYTEIDLIAFKKFKKMIAFYVIEITATEQNLIEEVKNKILTLRKNSANLLKFLKLDQHLNINFRGIVISKSKTDLRTDKIVKMINFKDIINNVKNLRIDKRRLSKIIE